VPSYSPDIAASRGAGARSASAGHFPAHPCNVDPPPPRSIVATAIARPPRTTSASPSGVGVAPPPFSSAPAAAILRVNAGERRQRENYSKSTRGPACAGRGRASLASTTAVPEFNCKQDTGMPPDAAAPPLRPHRPATRFRSTPGHHPNVSDQNGPTKCQDLRGEW